MEQPAQTTQTGPLSGVKIIEFAGIGPGPFAAMLLADMGADVIRIDRKRKSAIDIALSADKDLLNRGKKSILLDLKTPDDQKLARKLVAKADGLIEGLRPGVMEKMKLGPRDCLHVNPALVYGRMTGWGQSGPYAHMAGHDINFLALSGALYAMGEKDRPPSPPLNLIADFGGGAMVLALGMLAALLKARTTGEGDIIDAAMTDSCALLTAQFHGLMPMGLWQDKRACNFLDGSAPFYACYTTKDDRYMAVGAIEPQFYAELIKLADLGNPSELIQFNQPDWPRMKEIFAARFREKTQDEWCAIFDGTDACVTPVLSMKEAHTHPQNKSRQTFIGAGTGTAEDALLQPAPAPRFASQPATIIPRTQPRPDADREDILERWLNEKRPAPV